MCFLWRLSLNAWRALGAHTDRGELGGKGAYGSQGVCVGGWGAVRKDSVILTLNLHPAVTPPPTAADSSVNLPAEQLSHTSLSFSLLQLSSPFTLSCFCFIILSLFSLPAHRYTGIALPAPLRTGVLSDASGCIVCSLCC